MILQLTCSLHWLPDVLFESLLGVIPAPLGESIVVNALQVLESVGEVVRHVWIGVDNRADFIANFDEALWRTLLIHLLQLPNSPRLWDIST